MLQAEGLPEEEGNLQYTSKGSIYYNTPEAFPWLSFFPDPEDKKKKYKQHSKTVNGAPKESIGDIPRESTGLLLCQWCP